MIFTTSIIFKYSAMRCFYIIYIKPLPSYGAQQSRTVLCKVIEKNTFSPRLILQIG